MPTWWFLKKPLNKGCKVPLKNISSNKTIYKGCAKNDYDFDAIEIENAINHINLDPVSKYIFIIFGFFTL